MDETNYKSEWKKEKEYFAHERVLTFVGTLFVVLAFAMVLYVIHENSVVATMVRLSITQR